MKARKMKPPSLAGAIAGSQLLATFPSLAHHVFCVLLGGSLVCPLDGRAQANVNFVTIATSGQAGLTKIYPNVSINDSGQVALAGETAQGQTAFVGSGGDLTAVQGSMVHDRLYINNLNKVLTLRGTFVNNEPPIYYYDPFGIFPPWLVSPGIIDSMDFLQFWPATGGGSPETMASAFVHQEYDMFSTYLTQKLGIFWRLGPEFCANNQGQVVFVANEGNESNPSYVLVTREAPTNYVTLPVWVGVQPMLADDGTIVFQDGPAASGPIFTLDYLMNTVAVVAAPSMGFTALGAAPGISDDGQFIAFYGDLSPAGATNLSTTPGPGIFLSVRNSTGRSIVRLTGLADAAGAPRFASFEAGMRVGVNTEAKTGDALVVFMARAADGKKGIFTSRCHAASASVKAPEALVRQGQTVAGVGPVEDLALYDPLNTRGEVAFWAKAGTEAVIVGKVPTRVPVVLVHGWRGSSQADWDDPGHRPNTLMERLRQAGYEYLPGETWTEKRDRLPAQFFLSFDYSTALQAQGFKKANGDPRKYAVQLSEWLATFRRETDYAGQFDLVCHSMGALVSRWYMEQLGGGPCIRQWIGIGPVNQGAAVADCADVKALRFVLDAFNFLWPFDDLGPDLQPSGAISQMKTYGDTVTALANGKRSPDTIYRILVGTNPGHRRTFGLKLPFVRGRTAVRFENDGSKEPLWYYYGDGMVAFHQSRLPGVDDSHIDCFGDVDHWELTTDPMVLDKVMEYLKEPCKPSSGNCPPEDVMRKDARTFLWGRRIRGNVAARGISSTSVAVDRKVDRLAVAVTYGGSEIRLGLISPSGKQMVPDVYPVIDYGRGTNWESYTIEGPETGVWIVRVEAIEVPEGGEEYTLSVEFDSALRIELAAENGATLFKVGDAVGVAGKFLDGETPVVGAVVKATVTDPDGAASVVELFDDGSHGDKVAGDGVYCGAFSLGLVGRYDVLVEGEAGLNEHVGRVASMTLWAEPREEGPVLVISRSGSNAAIQWTGATTAFVLEATSDLSQTNWVVEPTAPVVSGDGTYTVTVPITGDRFFRLKSQ
jgi:pimeloyl-ACP methyl ester carboxylesterase